MFKHCKCCKYTSASDEKGKYQCKITKQHSVQYIKSTVSDPGLRWPCSFNEMFLYAQVRC
jgi:hypothetical protein